MGTDPFDGMRTEPCSFCNGSGTMRETKTLRFISVDGGEEGGPVDRRAIVGEPCPACV